MFKATYQQRFSSKPIEIQVFSHDVVILGTSIFLSRLETRPETRPRSPECPSTRKCARRKKPSRYGELQQEIHIAKFATITKDKNDEKVVAYASRALTDVEKRYLQTEKEALAIIWEVEHFHLYLYANDFVLLTDHKPLEVIYGSRKSKPPARIERWVLRLQPYSFKVVYKPGSNNPADYLSRHPTRTSLKQQKMTQEYVDYLTHNCVPRAMTLEEVKTATYADKTLKEQRAATKLNKWHHDVVKPYKAIKDELTVTSNDLILRGSRIVIPEPLQPAIDIAHKTHPGLSKTKALLTRESVVPKH